VNPIHDRKNGLSNYLVKQQSPALFLLSRLFTGTICNGAEYFLRRAAGGTSDLRGDFRGKC
jgi:hypothetical protein